MKHSMQDEEALFEAARQLKDGAARESFLAQACAGDAKLRQRLEELLAADASADKFLKSASRSAAALFAGGGPDLKAAGADELLDEQLGRRIGPYKMLQRIGEGGCGVVYMAEQEQPIRRRVALKIIKLGMDTKNVIARFEAERQALAMMDHPNIARVLDAGATEKGRPYFVMELVRGVRVTEYCDQNNLDTRRRLELFVQICSAIQHAHQKGVIHRDIKPSNILVTMHDGVPVPKVIDFGIAKAIEGRLTDQTLFTAYEQIIGTPAYMSPEQAEMSGLDVDTRSDIYSLGVLLYELLTGRTPFDAKELVKSGLDEMRRTLREKEPQRPSNILTTLHGTELKTTAAHRHAEPPKLISLLKGDLDWIVMKALEKDRTRRYETANGVAMDVQRHLNNEPVRARPPSRRYRFQKLVNRNRGIFLGVGAVTVALLAGLGASTWLYLKTRAAEHEQVHLRQLAEVARDNEAKLRQEAEEREKVTQAEILVNEEKFTEADAFSSQLKPAEATLESAALFRSLGEWHAVQNRWSPAVQRFQSLQRVDRLDGWDVMTLDHLRLGVALGNLGDATGFGQFRATTLADYKGTSNPIAAERAVKICLLLPADKNSMAQLESLGQTAAQAFENVSDSGSEAIFHAAWGSISVALWEYRRGNFASSRVWARRCLAYSEDNEPRLATAHVLLAMAARRLGDQVEAAKELAEARSRVERKLRDPLERGDGTQGFWFDWVFAKILLVEAMAPGA